MPSVEECRRQSELVQDDRQETEILDWLEAVADTDGWVGSNGQRASAAPSALLARLETQPALQSARWRRDELYDDDR